MKKIWLIAPLCLAYTCFTGAMLTSCNSNAKDELAHHHHDHGHGEDHDHETEEGHDHDAEGEHNDHIDIPHTGKEIVLAAEQAKDLGVDVTPAGAGTFHDVIKVSGQVMESADGSGVASAPTAGTLTFARGITEGCTVRAGQTIATIKPGSTSGGNPNAAAKATLDAAKRELDRVRPLHEHGIVSTAEFNAAQAAYDAARAAYSPAAASGRVIAPCSGTITQLLAKSGQIVDVGTPVASVSGARRLTLRADLPQRHYNIAGTLTGAKVRTPYSDNIVDLSELGGSRVAGQPSSSVRPGYIPVYFTFNNNGTLVPGTPVEVYLQGSPRDNVITVPVSAVSEQQGLFFVYVRVDDEGYVKVPVTLGESDGTHIEVIEGLKAGMPVVTKGAIYVRLAESSGVVPEGHSHSH